MLNLITILWMNTWTWAYHVVEKYDISQIKLPKRNSRKNSVKLTFFYQGNSSWIDLTKKMLVREFYVFPRCVEETIIPWNKHVFIHKNFPCCAVLFYLFLSISTRMLIIDFTNFCKLLIFEAHCTQATCRTKWPLQRFWK